MEGAATVAREDPQASQSNALTKAYMCPTLRGRLSSQRIDGTDHAQRPLVEHMRVDHGGLDVGVAEKFLHGADVLAGFQQMSSEAMAEAVGCEPDRQTRLPHSLLYRALDTLFVNVVSPSVPLRGSCEK